MKPDLFLPRKWYSPLTTLGELYVFDKWFGYTLEDLLRGEGIKVPGWTAIPQGWYKVKLTYSPAFERLLPLIYTNSKTFEIKKYGIKFSGVRFHSLNDHFDSEACVGIAASKGETQTTITTNHETHVINDFVIWDSKIDELCNSLEKGKEYSLFVKNM